MQKESAVMDWLLMDDEIAGKTARSLGLSVRAASYLPIYWTNRQKIEPLKALKLLDDLVGSGYRLSSKDYVVIKNLILEKA